MCPPSSVRERFEATVSILLTALLQTAGCRRSIYTVGVHFPNQTAVHEFFSTSLAEMDGFRSAIGVFHFSRFTPVILTLLTLHVNLLSGQQDSFVGGCQRNLISGDESLYLA